MASVNRVILIGNLGAKPEVRYLDSGQAVCELSVACNENWTDKQGNKHERTEWVRCVTWGKVAENCAQYLDKGRQVYVEGRLKTDKYKDKDGIDRYVTKVQAERVQFLGGGSGERRERGEQGQGGERRVYDERPAATGGGDAGQYEHGPPPDDDIPF